MPPLVLTIIGAFQMVVKAWPDIAAFYTRVKEVIQTWFDGGIITVEQQKALMDWADAHQAAVLAGEIPPEFQVEPDPEPPPAGV